MKAQSNATFQQTLKPKQQLATQRSMTPSRQVFDSLELIRSFPPHNDFSGKAVEMTSRFGKTLVLDLDETLVHHVKKNAEVLLSVRFPSGRTSEVGVNVRPFAKEFLQRAAELFEVVVFTSSHKAYADAVLDHLDPQRTLVTLRLYRNSCVLVNGVFVKDLRVLTGRHLKDLVIVDNAAYSFGYQIDNGVPVTSWYDDYEDNELTAVWRHLQALAREDDVRPLNAEVFGLSKLLSSPCRSLSQVYAH